MIILSFCLCFLCRLTLAFPSDIEQKRLQTFLSTNEDRYSIVFCVLNVVTIIAELFCFLCFCVYQLKRLLNFKPHPFRSPVRTLASIRTYQVKFVFKPCKMLSDTEVYSCPMKTHHHQKWLYLFKDIKFHFHNCVILYCTCSNSVSYW